MNKTMIIGIFEKNDVFPLRARHFGSTTSERMLWPDGHITPEALQSIISTITRIEGIAPPGIVITYLHDGLVIGEDHFVAAPIEAKPTEYRWADSVKLNNRYQTDL